MAKKHSSATQEWAQRTRMTVDGTGSGFGGTSVQNRQRDLAKLGAMQAARPLKPPCLKPRDPDLTGAGATPEAGVQSCVQAS